MAIAASAELVHLPFTPRPQYADPHPEGIAVGFVSDTGDATGGGASLALSAQGGFLYRFEGFIDLVSDVIVRTGFITTTHQWASDAAGFGITTFQLNWITNILLSTGISSRELGRNYWQMIRRFPMGRTHNVGASTIFQLDYSANTNTVSYQLEAFFSYWKTEARYRPGFLQSFYEAPTVELPGRP